MTSFQWRHYQYVAEKHHQINVSIFSYFPSPSNQNFWLRQCDRPIPYTTKKKKKKTQKQLFCS